MNESTVGIKTERLTSLDAFRGAIMISLISHGFGFSAFEGHPYLGFLAHQTEHVPWEGFAYWDLIQPAFMFMVGVAMPFAFAKRISLGDSMGKIYVHAFRRAFNLVLVAAIFTSINRGTPTYTLVNVLPQIAFGYLATLLVLHKSFTVQGVTAVVVLILYTIVWMLYPGNGDGGPWAMGHANMGGDFEKWATGSHSSGYWVSLNAIPSTSQIIAGAMCGKLLASDRSQKEVLKILGISAIALMVAGFALGFYIPIVKRILTASFALYSTGWAIFLLLAFYWIIDVKGHKRWTFFLIVIGMNSIAAYVLSQLLRGWINKSILVFTSSPVEFLGAYGEVLQALLVLAAMWYLFYFFYKKKVFFKV
jgi:predicted acyltransferase